MRFINLILSNLIGQFKLGMVEYILLLPLMNKLFAARLNVVSYSSKKLRRSRRGTKK